jgi:lysophospholipase L1-like esterase
VNRSCAVIALVLTLATVADARGEVGVRPVGTGPGASRSFMDLPGPSSGVESLSDGKATHATYDLRYRTLGRMTRPQLVFVNQYFPDFREKGGPNPIVVSATIRTRVGGAFRVTTAGRPEWTVAPGARVVTDPTPKVDVPPRTPYRIRVTVKVAHKGERWPLARPALPGGIVPYAPSEILAPTTRPAVVIFGDSIAHGYDNSAPNGGYYGGIVRALAGRAGYVTIATDSETAQNFAIPSNTTLRMASLQGVQYAIGMFGRNDLTANKRTLPEIQRDLVSIWQQFAARGIKVYACTILPATTSTDAWATTKTQRVQPSEPRRVAINDWIRAGAPIDRATRLPVAKGTAHALAAGADGHPLAGYFDTAAALETSRDSGLWKVDGKPNGYTEGGVHPTAAGYALMAKTIDPAVFTASPGRAPSHGSSTRDLLKWLAIVVAVILSLALLRELRKVLRPGP